MKLKSITKVLFIVLGFFLAHEKLIGQTDLNGYAILSGPNTLGTGTTLIGSSITINGISPSGYKGGVGAYKLVQTTGNASIYAHIYSGDKISITNSNIIQGNMAALNSSLSPTAISIGSSVSLIGNIDSKGSVVVGGGTVDGTVNVFPGTYTGPTPSNPVIGNSPRDFTLPSLPIAKDLSVYPALLPSNPFYSITGNFSQGPGNYGSVNYSGNKTLTLNGPGIYVFNSMLMTGNSNKIVFNFGTATSGNFYVYVKGNADLGKLTCTVNGGTAARIYMEVQGNGTGTSVPGSSFIIANGSGGGSKIQSTVFTNNAAINIGSGTGSTSLTGALLSNYGISIQSGVTLNYVPFDGFCTATANAGPDQIGTATCGLTTVTLAANPGTGQWTKVSGTGGSFGNTLSPTSTFTGIAGNTYTLRWTITNGSCPTTSDDVVVKFNQFPNSVDADPANKQKTPLDFTGHAYLTGSVSTDVTSLLWTTSEGVISNPAPPSPANTPNITVAAAGIYTLTGTNADGCTKSDAIEVTSRRGGVIGSELKSIYDNYPQSFNPDDPFFTFTLHEGDPTRYVTIDIIFFKVSGEDPSVTRQNIITLLSGTGYGLTNIIPNGISKFTITGDFPILNLPNLDALVDILNYSRPYYRPFNNGTGSITAPNIDIASEGDTTIRSYLVRKGYSQNGINLDGTGVKIGIISDSYRNLTTVTEPPSDPFYTFPEPNDVAAGYLPNYPPGDPHISDYAFNIKKTDEGRAMAHISYHVAKGAEIFFSTGVYTAGHFAETILDLAKNKNCKVIVDDVTYPTESFLKDGIVAKTVNKVVAENKVLYFTATGNFRNNAYESVYHGTISNDFPGLGVHDFGNGDIYQKVRLKPGSYMFVLQWVDNFYSNDETIGTLFDMNFYLSKTIDGKGLIGYNRINTGDATHAGGDPIEFIPIIIPDSGPDSTQYDYNVIITNNTSTTSGPEWVKYIVYKNDIQFRESFPGQYASTISGQGNAEGAITIGATRYYRVPGHPLLEANYKNITKPQIESFSSFGGTVVNNEATQRLQPSLTGPDGITTTVRLGPDYPIVDNFSNFYGSSAAAPHAAAGVSLILQGLKKFKGLNIQDIEPAEMKKLIQKTAVNMRTDNYNYNFDGPPDPTHYDFVAGAGLLNVDAAMRTFAAPEPFEIRLIRPTNLIPCQDPFTLTIVGENFSLNSVVYLDTNRVEPIEPDSSIKIPYSYISANRDTIKVTISTCIENPYIWVYTGPTAGLIVPDGGLSNGIRLFGQEIVVQTQPVTKKYGQDNPALSSLSIIATLIDNGVSIPIDPADFYKYGLDAVKLKVNTAASLYSPVNIYPYTVYRDFVYPVDTPLTNKYRYIFRGSTILIERMKLKVTPNNLPDTYLGNYVGNISFNYDFWQDQPKNVTEVRDAIKKFHENSLPGNVLAVVKDFNKAQAGGYVLSDADLTNLSMMTTFKALKNSRKFKIENNKLVPETDPNSLISQYLVDLASESIFDYKNNPKQAYFYEGYPGISKKALLSKSALENYEGQVHPIINGGSSPTLVSLLNGSASSTLAPLFNGGSTLAPLFNGSQISTINGKLATLNNGKLEELSNSPSIQYLNGTGGVGSLCYIINGSTLAPLFNGAQITLLDNSTITLNSANSYIKFQSNDSAGLYVGNMTSINNAINGTLAFILNGVTSPVANYKDLQNSSGTLVNGSTLAPLFNGSFIALNGTSGVGGLATLLNGGGVGGLATLLNGSYSATLAPLFNGSTSTLASLLNGSGYTTLASILNNVNLLFTNGATSATLAPLFNTSGGGGGSSNTDNTAVIVDETDVDEQNANYLGALFGINMITGLNLGQQSIIPGILINPNFDITYGIGHVNITLDPNCFYTHAPGKNFGSTTTSPTSLWVNLTTKVSGQLNADGKYLLFKGGTFTLNNITYSPTVANNAFTVPDGMIIARPIAQVPAPITHFDAAKNMWITEVPVDFASTSDLFITGQVVNSSIGFVKKNNNSSTSVMGYFLTNSAGFSDQWTYSMATYQPTFQLTDIDGSGEVVAVNGTYRAGTPKSIVESQTWHLVPGGSGGGGNNYTGSTLSFDKFTACPISTAVTSRSNSNTITMMESRSDFIESPFLNVYPNPASDRIHISFVPEITGNSRIILYTMDGKKAVDINNGMVEAGKPYLRNIDVGKLSRGVYLVQLWSGDKLTVSKIVISR